MYYINKDFNNKYFVVPKLRRNTTTIGLTKNTRIIIGPLLYCSSAPRLWLKAHFDPRVTLVKLNL